MIVDVEATTSVRQADAAYGSAANLAWLVEDKSIEPHIPVFDKSARNDGSFERADFVYDHDNDSYICPGGACVAPTATSVRRAPASIRTARSATVPVSRTARTAPSGSDARPTCPLAR